MFRLRLCSGPTLGAAILLLATFTAGCDQQGNESFSVEVRVENDQGETIEGATVGVRPCYTPSLGACGEFGTSTNSAKKAEQAKPVDLESWEVEVLEDNTALLTWETESETNVAGFTIEQKIEGAEDSSFNPIGFVDGAGTTDELQSYEHETSVAPGRRNAFRLVVSYLDGSESIVGDTIAVRPKVSENQIRPVFPNPLSETTTLEVLLASNSLRVFSKVHRLDGSSVETLVDRELASGYHAFRWKPTGSTPDGLYGIRNEISDDGQVAVQDTSYAAVISGPQNAFQIGETSPSGTVSTSDRSRFPPLFDVPEFDVRDSNGNVLARTEVSGTVQFVVTTSDGLHTFRRPVTEGENNFTLVLSP